VSTATLDRQDTDFESIVTLTILAGLPSHVVVGLAEWARHTEPGSPMLDVMGRELRDFLDARRAGITYRNATSPLHGLDR
jgi:hypothetical protein